MSKLVLGKEKDTWLIEKVLQFSPRLRGHLCVAQGSYCKLEFISVGDSIPSSPPPSSHLVPRAHAGHAAGRQAGRQCERVQFRQ